MTKHLGLAPSVFLRIFTRYTVGDFSLYMRLNAYLPPTFALFRRMRFPIYAGTRIRVKSTKSDRRFLSYVPTGIRFKPLSRHKENDKKGHHANPRQNQTDFLLHFCIHRYVITIPACRTFPVFHQGFTFAAMELRRFRFRGFHSPFRFHRLIVRLLFLQGLVHLRNNLLLSCFSFASLHNNL